MAKRARTACYERRMMYLERTIRRLSSRDGELRANNKRTSRCGAYRACSDLVLSACCTANKRHLLSGRDLDDKTTSRVAPGTPRDDEIPSCSLQARLGAREGGLKSLDVPWVLGVALQQIREAVLAERRPSGSPRSVNEICSNSRKKSV